MVGFDSGDGIRADAILRVRQIIGMDMDQAILLHENVFRIDG